MGKTFERTLDNRIMEHYKGYRSLDSNQYGFRERTGAEQAVLVHTTIQMYQMTCTEHKLVAAVSLDIEGAFDHVEWGIIFKELHTVGLPQYRYRSVVSYFGHLRGS